MRRLVLAGSLLEAMLEHARQAYPKECVGLLFGDGHRVTRRVPLPNVAERPETAFYAEPTALLRALREAEARGEAHLGVYHSHPKGPPAPSATDLREAYGGVAHLIVVPTSATVRAFWIELEGFEEITLAVEDDPGAPVADQAAGEKV